MKKLLILVCTIIFSLQASAQSNSVGATSGNFYAKGVLNGESFVVESHPIDTYFNIYSGLLKIEIEASDTRNITRNAKNYVVKNSGAWPLRMETESMQMKEVFFSDQVEAEFEEKVWISFNNMEFEVPLKFQISRYPGTYNDTWIIDITGQLDPNLFELNTSASKFDEMIDIEVKVILHNYETR